MTDTRPKAPDAFLTFEGIDASGKSLQAERLASSLRDEGYDVLHVREPGGTPIAERIRDILLDREHSGMSAVTELFLYEAARAQLVSDTIRPALAEGRIVISDRFSDSTVAYQGYGRSLPLDVIHEVNRLACSGISPLRTYILDIPWKESTSRRKNDTNKKDDRMESEKELFFEKVRKAYHAVAEEEPARILLLDGMRDVEALGEEIFRDAVRCLVRTRIQRLNTA